MNKTLESGELNHLLVRETGNKGVEFLSLLYLCCVCEAYSSLLAYLLSDSLSSWNVYCRYQAFNPFVHAASAQISPTRYLMTHTCYLVTYIAYQFTFIIIFCHNCLCVIYCVGNISWWWCVVSLMFIISHMLSRLPLFSGFGALAWQRIVSCTVFLTAGVGSILIHIKMFLSKWNSIICPQMYIIQYGQWIYKSQCKLIKWNKKIIIE